MQTKLTNKTVLTFTTGFVFYLLNFTSCAKPAVDRPLRTDSLPTDTAKTTIPNLWECTVDGKSYSGIIDTSFLQMFFAYGTADSMIISKGTSVDNKMQIHFKFQLDRKQFAATGVNNGGAENFLVIDTGSEKSVMVNERIPIAQVTYTIDSAKENGFVVRFTGILADGNVNTHNVQGRFSFSLNTGSKRPNHFYCLLDSSMYHGYFSDVMMSGNAMILEGRDYFKFPLDRFRIVVRTGGTIKPGTYKSSDGDINFYAIRLNGRSGYYYVDDSVNNMSVVIKSIDGDIVEGSFTGALDNGEKIEAGSFVCRLRNYVPQPVENTRWSFDAWIGPEFGLYNCYAGNTFKAERATSNGRYYLTIKGESDNGASSFRITVSDFKPIEQSVYYRDPALGGLLDTFYFKSVVTTWNDTRPHLYVDESTAGYTGGAHCIIDSIDDKHVTGRFFGTVANNLEDVYFVGSGLRIIRKGSFNADF